MQEGFDYATDKSMYDRLVARDVPQLKEHLKADVSFQVQCPLRDTFNGARYIQRLNWHRQADVSFQLQYSHSHGLFNSAVTGIQRFGVKERSWVDASL